MTSKSKVEASSSNISEISLTMDGLKKYLEEKLHISSQRQPSKDKILSDFTIDEIAKIISDRKKLNVITLAGAGISTSAGIPDFRSPGSGLYDNLQKYNLPCPQAIFELDFFEENPKPFFVLAKELYPGSFKPTPCHYFIKLLEIKGLLLRHYTQNIDTLERVAGISDEKLVEAHGTFFTGHCLSCRKLYSLAWMKERIFNDEIPICEACPGVVKPDIVFFGENLPDKFYRCADIDFHNCDLLIVLGSSLVVQPFASLVDRVSNKTPRLLINREKVGQNGGIMTMLGIGGGLEYDNPNNIRDVAWLGDCDEGCQLLADKLGWGEELKQMVITEHQLIDEELKKTKAEKNVSSKSKTKVQESKKSEESITPNNTSDKSKTLDKPLNSSETSKNETKTKQEQTINAKLSDNVLKKEKQIKGKPSSSKNGLN